MFLMVQGGIALDVYKVLGNAASTFMQALYAYHI